MNGADLFVRELQARGIGHIHTLTGNGLAPLFEACNRQGMRVIDTRNEQAAGYQADGIGRLTRKLAVCAVSSGVAHINGLTGLSNAWYDGSPMLLMTGGSESQTRGRGHFQDMDTVGLAAPLCKYAKYVSRVDRLALDLEAAIDAATSGRPGPVHLTIPVDVLAADATGLDLPTSRPRTASVRPGGRADDAAIAEGLKLLAAAERPFIVAGSGVFYADAGEELAALARALRAPLAVPIWERGAVERPIPEFVGVVGSASGQARILPDADVLVVVGTQVDYRIGYLDPPAIAADAKVIRVSVDPGELVQGVHPHLGLLGDPKYAMAQLCQALEAEGHAGTGDWLAEAKRRHRAFHAKWIDAPAPDGPTTGRHIVEGIRQVLTDDTFFLVDGGNIGQWVHMAMADRYPERWMTCGRSAVIGWGVPTAAAVRAHYPEAPVILLSGDGSATFTIAELECAARQKLPFVAIIADDAAWGIVLSGIRQSGSASVAAELGPVDYVKVAEGFGCNGIRVDDPAAIAGAIGQGLAETGVPTLLHIPIVTGGPAD